MKKLSLIAFSLLFVSQMSVAGNPILVTLTTNEYNPGSFYYSTGDNENGDGAFSPYTNVDIGLQPTLPNGAANVMTVTVGELGHGLCEVKLDGLTHQFTWVSNQPYTEPYSHKTYTCSAHYFEKYQHAFVYVVEVKQ